MFLKLFNGLFITLTAAFLFLLVPHCSEAYSSIDFYNEAAKYKAINPFAATIHCAHETGEWKSRLWTECNNGAGIKTNRAWKMLGMPYVVMMSAEDEGRFLLQKIPQRRIIP